MTTKVTTTAKVREKLMGLVDTVSQKDGEFTVRRSFFYTHGKTSDSVAWAVKDAFPNAKIIDHGEVWKPFNGGAPVAKQSHWWVKFRLED